MKKGYQLDNKGLPRSAGVYLIKDFAWFNELREIEVYPHSIKGLCCFSEDFGSSGTGINDETDCHVSVQCTGLEFLTKIRELN